MSRTSRKPRGQGLFRTPVLIEDTTSHSKYFEVSQLDNRILHAGKNGFLIRGTRFLKPNSEISIEIVDRLNNPVFASAVAGYEEGGSRLISIEIYEGTADGPANLIILGTAQTYADGRPIPSDTRGWRNRPNVRWVVPIQIETTNPNISPLRLANNPTAVITEKDYLTTRIDKTTVTSSLYTASLDYDYAINRSDGYAIYMLNNAGQPDTFFDTVNVDGIFTGSLFRKTIESSSAGTITTVSTGDSQGYVTASVSMSLDKVLNETTAITQTPIKFGDDTDYINPLLTSGSFQRVIQIADLDAGATKHTIEEYTSSVVFEYVSESLVNTTSTSSVLNFRIPFVQTITGEIAKVKISAKESNAAITSFVPFTEFVPGERNLITSSSLSGTQIGSFHQVGVFAESHILDSNWFSALFNKADGDFNQTEYESAGTSLTYGKTSITSSEKILEGAEVDHTASAVPYFFGTKTGIQLYKNVEYTLKYTAVYTPTYVTRSAGIAQSGPGVNAVGHEYTTSDIGSLKTFITRTANHIDSGSFLVNDAEPVQIGSVSKHGMWVDNITTRERDKSLYEREVNFKIPGDGVAYLRFKAETGFWNFGNIEITPAVERGFNPDEIIFDAENNTLPATTNDFKIQFLNFEDIPIDYHLIGSSVFVSASNLPSDGVDGSDGAAGTNAKTTVVNANSLVFVKSQAGTLTPSTITLTANNQNTTTNGAWSTSAGTLTSIVHTHTNASAVVTSGNFVDGMVVTYTLAGADGSVADSVTLRQLDEGSGTVQAILSNSAHVLPANSIGAVSSYAGSGTTIRVYEGATELTFVTGTPAAGQWAVAVGNTANITEGGVTDSGTYATIAAHSGAANGTDAYVITYTISGKTANGTTFSTFTQDQSLSKSKAAAPSISAVLSNETHTFEGTPAGVVSDFTNSGTTISVFEGSTSVTYDGTGTSNSRFKTTAAQTNIVSGSATDDGNTVTYGNVISVTADSSPSISFLIEGKDSEGTAFSITKLQTFSIAKAGDDGGAGPGVVYRGDYAAGTTYYVSATRKDIVKYNNAYWLASLEQGAASFSGQTPAENTYWDAFGATFSSVATDLLFAQEVAVAQGMTLGTLTAFTDATCDYNNDPTITHDANSNIVKGIKVSGTGIPADSYVASINSTTSFELNNTTTGGSVTNGTLQFQPTGFLRAASATSPTAGTGFWLDTEGNFRIGEGTGGDNYLLWDQSAGTMEIRGTLKLTGGASPNVTFREGPTPTALAAGDLWYNTSSNNTPYVATAAGDNQIGSGEWIAVTDSTIAAAQTAATNAQNTANARTSTFRTGPTPEALAAGDIWYNTSSNNTPHVSTGTGTGNWSAVTDATIGVAQTAAVAAATAATNAQNTANARTSTFKQDAVPTALAAGDVWYDTNDGNKPYVATAAGDDQIGSGEWIEVTDGNITAAAAAALTQANAGVTNAATAQTAINLMNTQVVLSNEGMALKAKNDGNPSSSINGQTLVDYGTTTNFYDGVASLAANVKLRLQASGIRAYADNITTYADLTSAGLRLYDDDILTADFSTDAAILYGASANDRAVVNSDGMSVYAGGVLKSTMYDAGFYAYGDNVTTYTSMTSAGITIVDNNVTTGTFTSGTVTLNGASSNDRVVIDATGMSVYTNNVLKASALDTGFTAYGDDVNTKAVMSSAGMTIFNDGTVADPGTGAAHFGSTLRIGAIADDTSRLEIDNAGNLTIRNRQSTTDTTTVSLTAAGALSVTGIVTATAGKLGAFTLTDTDFYGPHETLNNVGVKMVIGDMTGTPKIALGVGTNSGVASADYLSASVGANDKGFYADGAGNFRVGDATNYIAFTPGSPSTITLKGTLSGEPGASFGGSLTGFVDWTGEVGGGVYVAKENIDPDYRGTAGTMVVVASAPDASSHIAMFDSATGTAQAVKTDPGLTYNASTNILTAAGFAGPLVGNVTGNASGTAATVTGGTQAAITSAANLATVGTITSGVWSGTALVAGKVPNHDSLTGFVSDEHVAHGGVTITGTGNLGGGGTIASNRTITMDATITVTDCIATSDMTLKNVQEYLSTSKALEVIRKLQGFSYYLKDDDGFLRWGLSAQEVQKVIPAVVRTDRDGHLGIDYEKGMVTYLLGAVNELAKQLDKVTKRLEELEK